MYEKAKPSQAFSLVELSIVLVILGLLVGGVLSGQSLIRAAELRSISTDYSRFVAATQTFRDKYFALPGDMTNATQFWGAAHATPATCVTTASTSALTCNGNGDGIILPSTGSNESFRFWQQLANAGLIEGSYSGIQEGTTSFSSTTANSPKGRITTTLWLVWNWTANGGGNPTDYFAAQYDNILEFGGTIVNSDANIAILKPEELWNLDTKLDDGKPATGKLWARRYSTCTNATSVTDTAASYLLTSSSPGCVAIFTQAF